jgi:hypothetical protein
MSKNLEMSLLLDFYGQFLTPKQRDVMELYYYEDLSLAEISEHKKITRQGVHECIKRSQQNLMEFEKILQLAHKFSSLKNSLNEIRMTAENIKTDDEKIKSSLEHIKETAEKAQKFI